MPSLAELEAETAARVGPFALLEVLTADQGSLTVEVLKSTIDLGGFDDLYLLRREAGQAGRPGGAGQAYDPVLGQLLLDRRYVTSPLPSEPIELHHLAPALLRRGVRAGLRRCFCQFWLALDGEDEGDPDAPCVPAARAPSTSPPTPGAGCASPSRCWTCSTPSTDGAERGRLARLPAQRARCFLLQPAGGPERRASRWWPPATTSPWSTGRRPRTAPTPTTTSWTSASRTPRPWPTPSCGGSPATAWRPWPPRGARPPSRRRRRRRPGWPWRTAPGCSSGRHRRDRVGPLYGPPRGRLAGRAGLPPPSPGRWSTGPDGSPHGASWVSHREERRRCRLGEPHRPGGPPARRGLPQQLEEALPLPPDPAGGRRPAEGLMLRDGMVGKTGPPDDELPGPGAGGADLRHLPRAAATPGAR